MKNITINGRNKVTELEKEVILNNGALVLTKKNGEIIDVYMVVSFRDNKNQYNGAATAGYCTLVNMDNGTFAFEERCSRKTTVRRVLNHLLRLGCSSYAYNNSIPIEQYRNYDIEIVYKDTFTLDLKF